MSTEQLDPKDTFKGRRFHVHFCVVCSEKFLYNRPPGNKAAKTCSKLCANILRSMKTSGKTHTQQHAEKIRIALTGKNYSTERCLAISLGRKGKSAGSDHWNWNEDRGFLLARKKSSGAMRSILRHTLDQLGGKKNRKTEELLGYTHVELRNHLERLFKPGMTWENYGYGDDKWHIDHIKPVSAFEIGEHPKDVNALRNLQPLWQHENFVKGKKWEKSNE